MCAIAKENLIQGENHFLGAPDHTKTLNRDWEWFHRNTKFWTVPQRDILPLVPQPVKFIELLTQPGTDRGETLECVLTTGRGQMGRAPLNTGKRGGTGAR